MFGLFRRASSFGRGPQVSARPNFAPRVEPLEDRSTPATFNIANGDVAGLVAAITTANTNALPDTINLPAGGTFTLTAVNNTASGANGLPVILADGGNGLTINGNGSTIARDVAAPNFRILEVNNGSAPLAISGVTISGGKNPGVGGGVGDGGGILVDNNANLALAGSIVTGNTITASSRGGGIGSHPGSAVSVTGSTIAGNTATGKGHGQRVSNSLQIQDFVQEL